MVRFKSRFLLTKIETPGWQRDHDAEFPTKQELNRVLRDHFIETNGIAASGTAMDIQGKDCTSLITKIMRPSVEKSLLQYSHLADWHSQILRSGNSPLSNSRSAQRVETNSCFILLLVQYWFQANCNVYNICKWKCSHGQASIDPGDCSQLQVKITLCRRNHESCFG
jgi:hypothetical protein